MIHIVSGPPCAGKSTYVREHAKEGDLRVDYDLIAQALGSVNSHAAEGLIKQAAFDAREGAIGAALKDTEAEAWIIHTSPSEDHIRRYEAAGAEFIELDPGKDTCLERAKQDERPQQTIDGIERWYAGKKGGKKMVKTKSFEVKAENGTITGYASTWTREPDSYGDIVAKGAFAECIERIKAEGKILPLLWGHQSENLKAYIGGVFELEEDDHGLKFDATFDDTEEAQRARQLASDGRVCKFSFAYDVLDQAEVELEDGRKANELRKLNIHEVSLVMYPANPDTSVISVKSGRRNSAKDAEAIREAITLLQGVLGELEDIEEDPRDSEAKSEEPTPVNDKEQTRLAELLKEADNLLTKGGVK